MDGDFFRQVDPRSREAQEALRALLGTTLAQLNEIDKNAVGSTTNIRAVKTDLKNVLQNIETVSTPQPPVVSSPQPTYIPVAEPKHIQHANVPAVSDEKIDRIIRLLEDIKALLQKS